MERVGKYKVLRKLGEGGFGAVYLGPDPLVDEEVAIKVFRVKDENLAAFDTSSDKEAVDILRFLNLGSLANLHSIVW